MPRVAVVLSGCGVYDGSEIHEGVSVLLHLSRLGAAYACFAPDTDQHHVVNHLTGEPVDGERRNVLVEAARIARSDIAPLSDLNADGFDAVIVPGGFGAAKNLSTFAFEGAGCSVEGDLERVLRGFCDAGKPIGMCCIAPTIAARVFGNGCTVTIGDDAGTAEAIGAMGATHENRGVTETCVDPVHRLVTSPAYMYGDAPIHEVYDGIGAMVEQTLALAGAGV